MAPWGIVGKPVADTGEAARTRGAWLPLPHPLRGRGGGARFLRRGEGRRRCRGRKRSSCAAQTRNKRNQSPARAIKHSPRALFTGADGSNSDPPPPGAQQHSPTHADKRGELPPPTRASLLPARPLSLPSLPQTHAPNFHYVLRYLKPVLRCRDGIKPTMTKLLKENIL